MLYVAGFSTWGDPCSDGLNPTWRGPTAEPTRLEHVPSHASTPNKEMSTQKVWSFCFCGSVNLLLGYTSKWVGTSVWRYVERGSKGTPTAPVRRSAESCVSLAGSHTQTKKQTWVSRCISDAESTYKHVCTEKDPDPEVWLEPGSPGFKTGSPWSNPTLAKYVALTAKQSTGTQKTTNQVMQKCVSRNKQEPEQGNTRANSEAQRG